MFLIGSRTALLATFLLASGLPLLIFWIGPHARMLETRLADVEARHLVFAQGAAATLKQYHRDVALTFRAVSSMVVKGEDPGELEALARSLHFEQLLLVERETGVVLSGAMFRGGELPHEISPGVLANIEDVARYEGDGMGRVFMAQGNEMPKFILVETWEDVLVYAIISTDYVAALAENINFGDKGHAAVLDAVGRVIAHPMEDWRRSGRLLEQLLPVLAGFEGRPGVTVFHSPALNADVVAGYAPVEGPGWSVIVPQPVAEIQAAARHLTNAAIGILAAGLLLSAVLASVIYSLMARTLRRTCRAASHMAAGQSGVRLPAPQTPVILREFEELRYSFNTMASRIEDVQTRLERMAEHDALTGLLNRRSFETRARTFLQCAEREQARCELFYIDVDNFKLVNDSYGHTAGDAVLCEIAARLAHAGGVAARIGGDEFLLLARTDGRELATALQKALSAPVSFGDRTILLSCSIGAVRIHDISEDLFALIAKADRAAFQAKRKKLGAVCVFEGEVQRSCERYDTMLKRLRSDVLSDRIDVAFQPIIERPDGALCGFEALARWTPEGAAPVSPEEFVRLAEDEGLIFDLGERVRHRARGFAQALGALGLTLPVTVNVSTAELAEQSFVARFLAENRKAGLPPQQLVIEVTESIFEDRAGAARRALASLRSASIPIWLDDFGKGFSSHGLLSGQSFDALKVDMRLMGPIRSSARAAAVVASLVDLGRHLDMKIVLEGIETKADLRFAHSMGVELMQGFFLHEGLTYDAALALARSGARHPFAHLAKPGAASIVPADNTRARRRRVAR